MPAGNKDEPFSYESVDENSSRKGSTTSAQRRESFLKRLPVPHLPKIDSDCHFDLDEYHPKLPHEDEDDEDDDEEGGFPEPPVVAVTVGSKHVNGTPVNGAPRLSTASAKAKPEDDPEYKARWRSMWLATIILFLVSVQFSIYFSSLWPYLQILDPSVQESFFGLVVAGFSAGQIIASPIFARWSNKTKQVRLPIACGICICLVGNFIYIFAEAFPVPSRKWILLACRFIMGLASGITGIIRAYVATSSKLNERHKAIAQTTAAQSLGMTAGPLIQVACFPIGYPAVHVNDVFFLNEYTGPAYASIIACIILLVLLLCYFREYYSGIQVRTKQDPYAVVPKFNKCAAGLCIWFWFTMFFCVTNIETIESPYTMAIYNWTAESAVFYNGLILGGSGFISFCAYFIYACYGRRFIRERQFITLGLTLLCLFYVCTYPWPFYTRKLDYKYEAFTNTAAPYNGTYPSGWTNATTAPTYATTYDLSNNTAEPVGCDDKFEWCESTPWVPPEVYFISYPLISLGFPTVNVALSTLYSKILGPRPQNTMQSLMIMSGSCARLLGPIFISTMFQIYGPRISWAIIAIAVFSSIVLSIVFFKILIPIKMKPVLKAGEYYKYTGGTLHRM